MFDNGGKILLMGMKSLTHSISKIDILLTVFVLENMDETPFNLNMPGLSQLKLKKVVNYQNKLNGCQIHLAHFFGFQGSVHLIVDRFPMNILHYIMS